MRATYPGHASRSHQRRSRPHINSSHTTGPPPGWTLWIFSGSAFGVSRVETSWSTDMAAPAAPGQQTHPNDDNERQHNRGDSQEKIVYD
jgi:hypothetical protein